MTVRPVTGAIVKPSTLFPCISIASVVLAWVCSTAGAADEFELRRAEMVNEIAAIAATASIKSDGPVIDRRVLAVMEQVPRHAFVPDDQKSHAYENRPLPIGYGQTISQPFIVAVMTGLMMVKPGDVVLEVGTGSGYQAAILAGLARAVYTIEIIEPLGLQACERLQQIGSAHV